MADFTPIETQEALDAIISKRVERERAKYADYDDLKAYKASHDGVDVPALQEQVATLTKKVETLTQERDAKGAEAAEAAAKLTRIEVAQAAGLRPELADRIKGTTREEMEADAKTLASLQQPLAPLAGYRPSGEGEGSGDDKTAAYRTMLSGLRPNS